MAAVESAPTTVHPTLTSAESSETQCECGTCDEEGDERVKILLVQPSYYFGNGTIFRRRRLLIPLLTMPTIASYVPREHQVEIAVDYTEEIEFAKDYDLIAITGQTLNAKRAYDIADEFRRRGKKVVMGGIHASVLPDEALKHCDAVFIGEAEYTLGKMLEDFGRGQLQTIYRCDRWHDLKGLPVPRYDLLKTKSFMGVLSYQTTRGCPFDCDFCSVTHYFGRTFRHRPADEVVEHVKYIMKRYKPNRIFFCDDNITANVKYATELFEKLIPLKIKWNSQADVTVARKKELLRLAKKSGCTDLFVGIESINQASLDGVGKVQNRVGRFKEIFRELRKAGITSEAGMILGLDADDRDTFARTYSSVNKLKMPYPAYSLLTPFPGTRLRDRLQSDGRIMDEEWGGYNEWNVHFKPKLMSRAELASGYRWLFKKTFSLPSIVRRCIFPPAPELLQTLAQNLYNLWKVRARRSVWE